MRHAKLLAATALAALSLTAAAASAATKIYIGNGTGFFVNREGNVLTNEHVVSYCKKLTVSGLGGTQPAKVVARDAANDLALLSTGSRGALYGRFSSQKAPVADGDRVVIVGFPGKNIDAVTRESQILRAKGLPGGSRWIALDDVVEHGNSGGPVMDTSGNIVGVVSAKAMLLTYDKATEQEINREDMGMAIALPVVEDFLSKNRVRYETADTDVYLPTEHITDAARNFIVKVRCEYQTDVR